MVNRILWVHVALWAVAGIFAVTGKGSDCAVAMLWSLGLMLVDAKLYIKT